MYESAARVITGQHLQIPEEQATVANPLRSQEGNVEFQTSTSLSIVSHSRNSTEFSTATRSSLGSKRSEAPSERY